MATQSGLTGTVYYANNRILLYGDAQTTTEFVNIRIESAEGIITLTADIIDLAYEIDISKAIRYLLKNKAVKSNGGNILSYDTIQIIVSQGQVFQGRNYVFIGGGFVGKNTNIQAPNNTLLHSLPIPVWNNYQSKIYKIVNNEVIDYQFANEEAQRLPIIGCDSVFVRYKNSIGGVSQWLFERAEITESAKSKGDLNQTPRGYDITYNLVLTSRVPKDFQYVVSDLVYSDIIRVHMDDNFRRLFPYSMQNQGITFQRDNWINAKVKTTSMGLDYDVYKEMSITLELESNYEQGI